MFRDVRLGDDIDDFCVRCKRVMNHAVVSVIGGVAAKVRCRTCHSDHDFRHEQAPPPKVDSRKAALFNEVLKTVDPTAAGVELDAEPREIEAAELEMLEGEAAEPETIAMAAAEPATVKGDMKPAAKPAAKPAVKSAAKPASKAAAKSGVKAKPKAKK